MPIRFPEVSGLLTPTGKRINWLHTVVPNSRAVECFNETEAVYHRHKADMERLGINWGYFLTTNGPSGVGIETLINWSDAPLPIHRHYMKAAGDYATKAGRSGRHARCVATLTEAIIRRWSEIGAVHLQIGKKYPYLETREPATRLLIEQFKTIVDPNGLFNPGNLVSRSQAAECRQAKESAMKPWDGIISEEEQKAYRAAGFGKPTGFGSRPGLFIIDVQYRTVGTKPMPFWEAIKEFPTSCGEVGWKAVANIEKLVKTFRAKNGRSFIPT